jgi:hypothetical protein
MRDQAFEDYRDMCNNEFYQVYREKLRDYIS